MLRLIFAMLLVPSICFGANYYVDPTYDGSKGSSNGSYLRPWKTIAQVNSFKFSTGDDLYFKTGTHLVMTEPLTISWNGTASNRAVVGAYYGEKQFGLNGNDRPVLDGNRWKVPVPGSYRGIIELRNGAGYVTIQELEVRDSGARGINIGNNTTGKTSNNTVRNCLVYRPFGSGIVVERSSNNLIEDNIVTSTSYKWVVTGARTMGAAIEITAQHAENTTMYNIVRGNTVSKGTEGIGLYKQARYTTVENNTVFDCRTYHIYLSRTRNNTVRNNLIYSTPNSLAGANGGAGIAINSELNAYKFEVPIGWHEITNNYVGGMAEGMSIGLYPGATIGHKNLWISKNRFVDNSRNIRIWQRPEASWENNEFSENYFFIQTSGLIHSSDMLAKGFIWNGNYFNTPPTVDGKAVVNARYNVVNLIKNTGWRNLKSGQVDKSIFSLVGETSLVLAAPVLRVR
jgi:parallel beta-helix repeat protein